MEKNKNNQISWLGLMLTKKRAIYLTVLSTIGSSFFATSVMFTLLVLQFLMTNISPDDNMMYFYTFLLFLSNFIASSICIGIFSYTISKARTFRKSLKKQ